MKRTRAQQREKPPLGSALVLPCTDGSRKVTLETYFATMNLLSRAKNLTDLLVCWMHRSGYRELTLERTGSAEEGLRYRMTLKPERRKEKRK